MSTKPKFDPDPVVYMKESSVAMMIADGVCTQCNTYSVRAYAGGAPYKAQSLLEEVIKELQGRV